MGDMDQRYFDLFVGSIEIEREPRELANAELAVDMDADVNFLSGGAVGLEADVGFEEFDLSGSFGSGGFGFGFFCGWWRRLLAAGGLAHRR